MARVGVYEEIKKALQDLVAPELHAIRGDIHGMRADIRVLDQRIDGVNRERQSDGYHLRMLPGQPPRWEWVLSWG